MPSKQACLLRGLLRFEGAWRCETILEEKNATCCKNLLWKWR